MKINGDVIGKIIVILIIAALAGVCAWSVLGKTSNSSMMAGGGMPSGMGGMPSGGGAPSGMGGMPSGSGAPSGDSTGSSAESGMPTGASGMPAGGDMPNNEGGMSSGASGVPSSGQRNGRNSESNTSTATNTITVSALTLKKQTIQSTVKVNGDVSAKTQVKAYPDTSGKITKLFKSLGDSVKKGEIIAYVDPSKPGTAYAESPVVSPYSGTIIETDISIGDSVTTQTSIASIGSVQDLQVAIAVSEKYTAYLKTGLPAYLTLTSAPDEKFSAKISSISPVVNSANRTIKVVLSLDKYDSRIKPGMFAEVDLVIRQSKNALVVPRDSLKTYNANTTVFVIDENNCAKRIVVETGISNDIDIEITSGLEEGQTVITAGSVTEGSPVRIAGE